MEACNLHPDPTRPADGNVEVLVHKKSQRQVQVRVVVVLPRDQRVDRRSVATIPFCLARLAVCLHFPGKLALVAQAARTREQLRVLAPKKGVRLMRPETVRCETDFAHEDVDPRVVLELVLRIELSMVAFLTHVSHPVGTLSFEVGVAALHSNSVQHGRRWTPQIAPDANGWTGIRAPQSNCAPAPNVSGTVRAGACVSGAKSRPCKSHRQRPEAEGTEGVHGAELLREMLDRPHFRTRKLVMYSEDPAKGTKPSITGRQTFRSSATVGPWHIWEVPTCRAPIPSWSPDRWTTFPKRGSPPPRARRKERAVVCGVDLTSCQGWGRGFCMGRSSESAGQPMMKWDSAVPILNVWGVRVSGRFTNVSFVVRESSVGTMSAQL